MIQLFFAVNYDIGRSVQGNSFKSSESFLERQRCVGTDFLPVTLRRCSKCVLLFHSGQQLYSEPLILREVEVFGVILFHIRFFSA
jgi:hypothetical protein